MIKTLKDYPIKQDYYYIVDFKNYYKLRVYPVYFVSQAAAQRSLDRTVEKLKTRKHYYQIVSGRKLKGLDMPYIFKKKFFSRKYTYPLDREKDKQKRKTYRTVLRRRLRRMGLLTLIKPKYRVDKGKREQIRIKPNTQKVANSPNTVARVFRLERKPKKYYYLIRSKSKTKAKGILLKIKSIRLNIKTGELKKVTVNMRSTDILIPHLLTEIPNLIKHLPNDRQITDRLRKKGFDCFYKSKQKEDL